MPADRIWSGDPGGHNSARQVIYWMQQAQRAKCNHALNLAVEIANARQIPLCVAFVISDAVPDAQAGHYRFMLEGLAATAQALGQAGLSLILLAGAPAESVAALAGTESLVVADHGYLRWQRNWRQKLSGLLPPDSMLEVESDVVVPVRAASDKEEYAAATLRGKLLRRLPEYLEPCARPLYRGPRGFVPKLPKSLASLVCRPATDTMQVLDFAAQHLRITAATGAQAHYQGGYPEAEWRLEVFLEKRLHLYAAQRNDPALDIQSGLSPYLHFGQISALEVALRALEFCGYPAYAAADLIRDKSGLSPLQAGLASFLEELIVRRELSCNFCHHNPHYDSYDAIPGWARTTLNDHLSDPRPHSYGLEELETAQTLDPFWNAAQREMTATGKMHNYMRMYWGKKLIEWLPDPESAFQTMLYLNNKYELDGRDPNSYAGVAWCFGKHDRPWQQRPIFGSVRYMNAAGLKRKFDMQAYLDKVDRIAPQPGH